ncbi:hypothetical protein CsatA_026735 [Cannabis sativa]
MASSRVVLLRRMASIGSASSLQCRDLGNQSLPLLDLLSSLSLIISSFLVEDRRSQETKVIGRTSVLFFCFSLSLSLSLSLPLSLSLSYVQRSRFPPFSGEVDGFWSWFVVAFQARPCFRF